MASLDNAVDLTEKLVKQNIDYILITIQRGKPENKLHLFYSIPDKEAVECLSEGVDEAIGKLVELEEEYKKKDKKKNGKK